MSSARHITHRVVVVLVLLVPGGAFALPAQAAVLAEIALRAESRARGSIVLLGDLADVHLASEADAERLTRVELFPAPAAGETRVVRLREIQDVLALRGVNLAVCQFSGPSVVRLLGPPTAAGTTTAAGRLTAASVKQASANVERAVVDYLEQSVAAGAGWQARVELSREQAAWVLAAGGAPQANGGRSPWTGHQSFRLTVPGAPGELEIAAEVTLPSMTVVAARALRRGERIRPADVRLEPSRIGSEPREEFHRIEEVIGKETTRALATGQPLERPDVRSPLLVRRNDVVTVHAYAAGVHVRTHARAMEDGSDGDLITVQSLLDRQQYMARVTDIQEVSVYAAGASAASAAAHPAAAAAAALPRREDR